MRTSDICVCITKKIARFLCYLLPLSPKLIEVFLQCTFCGEDSGYHGNQLDHYNDPTDRSNGIHIGAKNKKHCDDGERKNGQRKDFPQPANILVGKIPGAFVFHGSGCAVTKYEIDVVGRFLCEKYSKAKHCPGDQKHHYEHKNPESDHAIPPQLLLSLSYQKPE